MSNDVYGNCPRKIWRRGVEVFTAELIEQPGKLLVEKFALLGQHLLPLLVRRSRYKPGGKIFLCRFFPPYFPFFILFAAMKDSFYQAAVDDRVIFYGLGGDQLHLNAHLRLGAIHLE